MREHTRQELGTSSMSGVEKGCLSATATLKQGFLYFKAFLVGQTKKITARNEKEASEADLVTAKMQVEAADEAEHTKNRLR